MKCGDAICSKTMIKYVKLGFLGGVRKMSFVPQLLVILVKSLDYVKMSF